MIYSKLYVKSANNMLTCQPQMLGIQILAPFMPLVNLPIKQVLSLYTVGG